MNPINHIIEKARSIIATDRQKAEAKATNLETEIQILQRFAELQRSAEEAQEAFKTVSAQVTEYCDDNFIPSFAANLVTDSKRLELLAPQIAARAWTRFNLPEVIQEIRKRTIEDVTSTYNQFVEEHKTVLKRHGAI
jgi:hypothetical protein